jgi:hypothetical protein
MNDSPFDENNLLKNHRWYRFPPGPWLRPPAAAIIITSDFPNTKGSPRCRLGKMAASERTPGQNDASIAGGSPLGQQHQRRALEKLTWRCRDRLLKPFAQHQKATLR